MIVCFYIFVLSIITFLLPALFFTRSHIKVKIIFLKHSRPCYTSREVLFNTDDHAIIRYAKY